MLSTRMDSFGCTTKAEKMTVLSFHAAAGEIRKEYRKAATTRATSGGSESYPYLVGKN